MMGGPGPRTLKSLLKMGQPKGGYRSAPVGALRADPRDFARKKQADRRGRAARQADEHHRQWRVLTTILLMSTIVLAIGYFVLRFAAS